MSGIARVPSLPEAPMIYDRASEQIFRVTVEQEMQDIRNRLDSVESNRSTLMTLSGRRHQFLLMGMANGG